MKLERKHAWFLIGVALWGFVIWARFIKALADQHADHTPEPSGYYPAHIFLIVVNLVLSVIFLVWGVRALRRAGSTSS